MLHAIKESSAQTIAPDPHHPEHIEQLLATLYDNAAKLSAGTSRRILAGGVQ